VTTFIDPNNNGVLDQGEAITSISTICNGVNGKDGTNAHLTQTPATPAQCPYGGTVFTATDEGQSQQTIICNGKDGKDGSVTYPPGYNGPIQMGKVGPDVQGKLYSACHHDYMYVPGGSNSSAGWLMFRHQKNGLADQGPGVSGFDVWNVDVADFLFVSERGLPGPRVTYCQGHWDPFGKVLSYTVVDDSDCLKGLTGTIKF
jgi:hypothetical protein